MFEITEEAVERTSQALVDAKYDLRALFTSIKGENLRVADYIKSQADKSRSPMEVYGTGIVVYLLLKHQWEINHPRVIDTTGSDPTELKEFQDFLENTDLGKIP